MSVISGASGKINGITNVANWTISPSRIIAKAISSAAPGAPTAVVGVPDWLLRFKAYGKVPPVLPGSAIGSFVGHTGGNSYTGACICEKVTLNVDITGASALYWDVECGGNSVLATGSTSASDAGAPAKFTGSACKVQWNGSTVGAVQRYTMELMNKLNTYVPDGGTYMGRIASGIVEGSFSIDQFEGDPTARLAEGDIQIAKFFVDASLFWQMGYGCIESCEHDVPIEGGGIVPYRWRGSFSGWKTIAGTPTKGSILKPDTTAFWN